MEAEAVMEAEEVMEAEAVVETEAGESCTVTSKVHNHIAAPPCRRKQNKSEPSASHFDLYPREEDAWRPSDRNYRCGMLEQDSGRMSSGGRGGGRVTRCGEAKP